RADPRPSARGCHRDNAGTRAHIQHRLASPDAGNADEMSRDGCREGGRRRERGPGLALLALEIHEGIVAHGTSRWPAVAAVRPSVLRGRGTLLVYRRTLADLHG